MKTIPCSTCPVFPMCKSRYTYSNMLDTNSLIDTCTIFKGWAAVNQCSLQNYVKLVTLFSTKYLNGTWTKIP